MPVRNHSYQKCLCSLNFFILKVHGVRLHFWPKKSVDEPGESPLLPIGLYSDHQSLRKILVPLTRPQCSPATCLQT